MSSFTSPLNVRFHGLYDWEVLTEFSYYRTNDENKIITVPEGFRTDLATVPRWLWSMFPPHDSYAKAAVIHDYLYYYGIGTKKEADLIFKEALEVLELPKWKVTALYNAVKFFGKGNFDRKLKS